MKKFLWSILGLAMVFLIVTPTTSMATNSGKANKCGTCHENYSQVTFAVLEFDASKIWTAEGADTSGGCLECHQYQEAYIPAKKEGDLATTNYGLNTVSDVEQFFMVSRGGHYLIFNNFAISAFHIYGIGPETIKTGNVMVHQWGGALRIFENVSPSGLTFSGGGSYS